MNHRLVALCGVLMLLATLGCGNKGPLYLPQEAADQQQKAETEKDD